MMSPGTMVTAQPVHDDDRGGHSSMYDVPDISYANRSGVFYHGDVGVIVATFDYERFPCDTWYFVMVSTQVVGWMKGEWLAQVTWP